MPPADGVAFYVQDFALNDPQPWKIPSRIERTTAAELAARFARKPRLNANGILWMQRRFPWCFRK